MLISAIAANLSVPESGKLFLMRLEINRKKRKEIFYFNCAYVIVKFTYRFSIFARIINQVDIEKQFYRR